MVAIRSVQRTVWRIAAKASLGARWYGMGVAQQRGSRREINRREAKVTAAHTTHRTITGGEKTIAWVLLGIAIAANAAGYFLNWFGRIAWYDDVVHGYTIFALTLVLALSLYGTFLVGARDHGLVFVLTVASVGLAIGGLWEVAEWAYDQWFAQGNAIQGKMDSVLDLVWDTLGALFAGVVARAMAKG